MIMIEVQVPDARRKRGGVEWQKVILPAGILQRLTWRRKSDLRSLCLDLDITSDADPALPAPTRSTSYDDVADWQT